MLGLFFKASNEVRIEWAIKILKDPESVASDKRRALDNLKEHFDENIIEKLRPLGIMSQNTDLTNDIRALDIPWDTLFETTRRLTPHQLDLLKPIAQNFYMDTGAKGSIRYSAIEFIIEHYWEELGEIILHKYEIPNASWFTRHIGTKITNLNDVLMLISLHGRTELHKGRIVVGSFSFLLYLSKLRIDFWTIIEKAQDPYLVVGSVHTLLTSLISYDAEKKLISEYYPLLKNTFSNWDKLLTHPDSKVRWIAARVGIAERSKIFNQEVIQRFLPQLKALLDDEDPYVRSAAVGSLARIKAIDDWNIIKRLANSKHPVEQRMAVYLVSNYNRPYLQEHGEVFESFMMALDTFFETCNEDAIILRPAELFKGRNEQASKLIMKWIRSEKPNVRQNMYYLTEDMVTDYHWGVARNSNDFPWTVYREQFWNNYLRYPEDRGRLGSLFGVFRDEQFFSRIMSKKGLQNDKAIAEFLALNRVNGTLPILAGILEGWEHMIFRGDGGHEVLFALRQYTDEEILSSYQLKRPQKEMIIKTLNENRNVFDLRRPKSQ